MKVKWPKLPPPTLILCLAQFAVAGLCAGLALVAETRWVALLNAGFAGANIAAGVFNMLLWRIRIAHVRMSEAFDAMGQLNAQLIAGKVEIMMRGGDPNGDRPSVH